MTGDKPKAVVFYARDFLSVEFPQMARGVTDLVHVYIVVSVAELGNVRSIDPDGVIFRLGDVKPSVPPAGAVSTTAYNNDRYLRSYGVEKVRSIVEDVESLCAAVLAKFDVRFYLDEPVSGFPNFVFNRQFTEAGATCLHFQTTWLPGYMFFSSDPAHAVVPRIGQVQGGAALVRQHIEQRLAGGALPLYVLNYSSTTARLRDAAVTVAKACYRRWFRSEEYYLDSDTSAHLTHASSLLASLRGGYADPAGFAEPGRKFILYPLHYDPEAILNYFSDFSRQEEIAEQMLDALPLGYELLLKEHPSQPGALNLRRWRSVTRHARVLKVRGDVNARSLLRYDVAVVSIGSTLAIEAALAGRPVGVLGKVHFAGMPGIRPLSSPRDLQSLLSAEPASREQIEQWYGEFMEAHCFQGNIMKGRTTDVGLAQILARVSALKSSAP